MISKRVPTPKGGGSFGGLAEYIAADKTNDNHDKLDHLWMVNCNAGEGLDDLKLGILEIENTQEMNQRAEGSKTYHLIISFQSGESLPHEELAKIERRYADALGFTEHQRIVASHKNTDNYHMHVAYNMVHPESHNIHHPSWDYYARDKVCRSIEKEYGLKVDNGHEKWKEWRDANPDEEHTRIPSKARDMEAHRHEQSFTRSVQEQKDDIVADIKEASDWAAVHTALEAKGLTLKPRANGLIITNGTDHTKASSISRKISLKKLEDKFGSYQNPEGESEQPTTLSDMLKEQKDAIKLEINAAKNWQELHDVFSSRDIELRKRGNGFAIYADDEHVTASSIDRSFTKKNLEQRLGTFERPDSTIDKIMKTPEMLGSVLQSAENWQETHETLQAFNLKLAHRGQGYIEATFKDKDDLLDGGARYDKKLGHWYIPKDAHLDDFKGFKTGFVLTDGQHHIMSHKLPSLDKFTMQERLGDYEPTDKPESIQKQPKPLTILKTKQQRGLWDQFLAKKRSNPTLSWKEFLLLMAGADPMAVAILQAGRKILFAFNDTMSTRSNLTPKSSYDPLRDEKYMPTYIQVPFKEGTEAKAAGAKWDPNMKSYFIPEKLQTGEYLKKFDKWPVGLPEIKTTISRKKARDMGVDMDDGMSM